MDEREEGIEAEETTSKEAEETTTNEGEEATTNEGERPEGERLGRDLWGRPLADFQEVIGDLLGSFRSLPLGGRAPRYDLIRLPEAGYWILMDLPGVDRAELEVSAVADDLVITGKRRRPELPDGSEVVRSERDHGRFRREIRIPSDVDLAGVQAKLENGVLRLELPYRSKAGRTRIEIEE
ncbi:MAG: Hsp20/alpha crystallin family protein [Gemmatimonadetes bacterium]|nr:Hsp20/alpha crystallin family protein [Gemmatimonadota bacterium]